MRSGPQLREAPAPLTDAISIEKSSAAPSWRPRHPRSTNALIQESGQPNPRVRSYSAGRSRSMTRRHDFSTVRTIGEVSGPN